MHIKLFWILQFCLDLNVEDLLTAKVEILFDLLQLFMMKSRLYVNENQFTSVSDEKQGPKFVQILCESNS